MLIAANWKNFHHIATSMSCHKHNVTVHFTVNRIETNLTNF